MAVAKAANSLPGFTSTPTVASPFAGTVTVAPSAAADAAPVYAISTPLPRQSVELPVKYPPSTFSDRAWELSS